jgi:hypothetical protein
MSMLTVAIDDTDHERIYFTRFGTVVSYVQTSGHGGLIAVVEPGPLAFPKAYATAAEAVRRAMFDELARRLDVPPERVLGCSFDSVRAVADPLPKGPNPWTGVSRSRRRSA